jgi:hypothetical protein
VAPTTASQYLGDGVYVSFDGHQLKLDTRASPNPQEIYLDTNVYAALVRFVNGNKGEL